MISTPMPSWLSATWRSGSFNKSGSRTLEQALAAAQRAIALNDSLSWGRLFLGYVYLWQKQYEQAITEMERAIALNPDDSGYVGLANTLGWMGRSEEALQMIEQALRRQPHIVDEIYQHRRRLLSGRAA